MGRLRGVILISVLWAVVAVLLAGVISAALKVLLLLWPDPSPLLAGFAGVLLTGLFLLWLRKRPWIRIREAITPKYWEKIRQARAREKADPYQKTPPFRLDPEQEPGLLRQVLGRVSKALVGGGLRLFRFASPNIRIWPLPIRLVTRFSDVRAVLQDTEHFFTPFGAEMEDMGGGVNFVLGVNGPAHEPARSQLDEVIGSLANPGDRSRVSRRAAQAAGALVDQAQGRMDVVADLIRRTAAETCIDYFGLEAPDPDALADWTIAMSALVFSDPFGSPDVRARALQAARLFSGVVEKSLEVGARRTSGDTLVTRLLALEKAGKIQRSEIPSFLAGNATGMIPTTTIGMTNIITELMSRPLWWAEARRLAAKIQAAGSEGATEDRARFQDILLEAARLSPTLYPGQWRIVAKDGAIAPRTLRGARVRAGDLIMVSTGAALRDRRRFRKPHAFNPDRPQEEKAAARLIFG
ncbi:cytochrome P450, partial [Phenylobacterium sp.]|uniref:cytochrome P450 n=1 Tax=Phenylobacterium sp. TaxID=1871053 RepID=UPI0025FFC5AC